MKIDAVTDSARTRRHAPAALVVALAVLIGGCAQAPGSPKSFNATANVLTSGESAVPARALRAATGSPPVASRPEAAGAAPSGSPPQPIEIGHLSVPATAAPRAPEATPGTMPPDRRPRADISGPTPARFAHAALAPRPRLKPLPPGRVDVFGSVAHYSGDSGMFRRFHSALQGSLAEVARADDCRPSLFTRCPVRDWRDFLESIRGRDRVRQLQLINDYINRSRYVSDELNYGLVDKWATLGQMLQRGGDCEDYVLAKYVSLRTLGIPPQAMRIVIVRDEQRRIAHAVLLVEIAGQTLVLDNAAYDVRRAPEVTAYRPIYSINEDSWWMHRTIRRRAPVAVQATFRFEEHG